MKTYSGVGTLHFADGKEFTGSVAVDIVGNGDISARFSPEVSPFMLSNNLGAAVQLRFACDDGSSVEAQKAMVTGIGEYVTLKLAHVRVAGIPRKRHASTSRYQLANCVFSMGSHLTEYPGGGGSWNAIEIRADDALLRIVKIDAYDAVVGELEAQKDGGVTALLEVTGPTDPATCDVWATAVCNLLALSTKNTVRWVSRERGSEDGRSEIEYFSPAVYRIRRHRSLIPDMSSSGKHELHAFLQSTLPRYASLDNRERISLGRVSARP